MEWRSKGTIQAYYSSEHLCCLIPHKAEDNILGLLEPTQTDQLVGGLGVRVGIDRVEIFGETALACGVGGGLDHGSEDGFEEAGIFGKGGAVARGEGGFDGLLCGGSDELEAANEDADCRCWCGCDAER